MIAEILGTGKANAQTAAELAARLNRSRRSIMEQIRLERTNGSAICAGKGNGDGVGYWLAEDGDELEAYCRQIYNRAMSELRTLQALKKSIPYLPGEQLEIDGVM